MRRYLEKSLICFGLGVDINADDRRPFYFSLSAYAGLIPNIASSGFGHQSGKAGRNIVAAKGRIH
jgi:hypothetical protein